MAKNQDEEVMIEETENADGEPRVYELGFHLDPELPVEEVKKVYQAVRDTIGKATVVAEVEPRKIKLAYTISRQDVGNRRDFHAAYFAWIAYETDPRTHADIITAAGANKSIIRFIDLITTKDQARHALEMQELMEKTTDAEEMPEEALDAELDTALENVRV